MPKRPLGLILICISVLLNSVTLILGSLISLYISIAGIPCVGERYWTLECMYEPYGQFVQWIRTISGIVGIVIGAISLVIIKWLWNVKKKGLKYATYLFSIALIGSLLQSNYLGILLSIVILVYLVWKKDIFKH